MKQLTFIITFFYILTFFYSCNQNSQQNGNEIKENEVEELTSQNSNSAEENQIPPELLEDIEKAIAKVRELPEVSRFLNEDKENSFIQYDHMEGDTLFIHVYKIVKEESEGAHNATFNWYKVNRKNGSVSAIF
jgi:hypothetical protein